MGLDCAPHNYPEANSYFCIGSNYACKDKSSKDKAEGINSRFRFCKA